MIWGLCDHSIGGREIQLWFLAVWGEEGRAFCPRRGAENGDFNVSFHEGPRRTAKNCNCNTFIREETLRTATSTSLSTKGREGPRRAAKNCNCNCNTLIREGPRRDAKNCDVNVFIHEGPRRTATSTPLFLDGGICGKRLLICKLARVYGGKGFCVIYGGSW